MIGKRFETEASGGISLQNVRQVAMTGVDYISWEHWHTVPGSLDLSLKIQEHTLGRISSYRKTISPKVNTTTSQKRASL